MEWLFNPEIWIALVTLTALEIVLGIDNIIFIAVLAQRLPSDQQSTGRRLGLAMAMFSRILLLFCITWIMKLISPLFLMFGEEISGRDIILISGGLFLLGKSTLEIHAGLEGEDTLNNGPKNRPVVSFGGVIFQIMLLDVVFSLDSVITAVGLTHHLPIMVASIIIAVVFMIYLADSISAFIEDHPTLKILALSFLLMVGVALIGEGLDLHIPKGYIYFAMAFSIFVEMLNMKIRKQKVTPIELRRHSPGKILERSP